MPTETDNRTVRGGQQRKPTNAEKRIETFFPELFQERFSEFEGNFPQAIINNCLKNSNNFCTFADDSGYLGFVVLCDF
jgi:hypothetical protein